MKEVLREKLLPLYCQLLNKISSKDSLYTFCMQWGRQFPAGENEGILFVGKATNGWITSSRALDVLFGDGENRVFARGDQMKWVSLLENNKKEYNTRKSVFWRVIKRVAQSADGQDDWYTKIAWSNLYKVSLLKGNPTEKLKWQQAQICREILEEEIKILKPKIVIFLTSGWEQGFIQHLLIGHPVRDAEAVKWGGRYTTKGYQGGDIIFITSPHPQGKKEDQHVKAIKEVMLRFKDRKTAVVPDSFQ